MTRLEKAELLKSKGYTYDPDTGKIYGSKGSEIKRKNNKGYISINSNHIIGNLLGHHFAYYWVYGNVDFIELDHENRIRHDNRICNLRILDRSGQGQNRSNVKGYSWRPNKQKWQSIIQLNKKQISLGYFNTEEEAQNAYIEAKKKYHII
jgi:hypothetical protein